MKFRLILLGLLPLLLATCKKAEPQPMVEAPETVNTPLTEGLPGNMRLINGLFFYSRTNYPQANAFAFIADPRKDLLGSINHDKQLATELLGNVSVGLVTCADAALTEIDDGTNSIFYEGSPRMRTDSVMWTINGNGPYHGFSLILPRGAPEFVNFTHMPYNMLRSKDLVIDFNEAVPAYDSLILILGVESTLLRKGLGGSQKQVVFTAEEIKRTFPTETMCTLEFIAYNYSHCTINSKYYIFECRNSTTRTLNIYD